jgi:hypothetical protein
MMRDEQKGVTPHFIGSSHPKMKEIGKISLGFGLLTLVLFLILIQLKKKIRSLENRKMYQTVLDVFFWTIVTCGVTFAASVLLPVLDQPSAFEKCMEQANGQIDPEAIAWYESYCSQ